MTAPVPPISEPDPSALVCPGDHVGSCSSCQRKTHRYGYGGNPLCSHCFAAQHAKRSPGVKHIGRAALAGAR
ncbi:hypothetical protein E4K10_31005 [Streptomyces sp. T1317-0309]|nr:hypothetical protein E4K10_31005 [Streptomyces sp. T1317-0309]